MENIPKEKRAQNRITKRLTNAHTHHARRIKTFPDTDIYRIYRKTQTKTATKIKIRNI